MLGWIVSATADLSGSPQSTRPSSHTHPGLRKTIPVSRSRLQRSLGLRRLLLRADAACVAALAREPDRLPWTQTQPAAAGEGQETPHRPGPPERDRASLGRALVQALLQRLTLGCPVRLAPRWPVSQGNSSHRLKWERTPLTPFCKTTLSSLNC